MTIKLLVLFLTPLLSGLAIYLVGVGYFKRLANTFGRFPLSHLAGLNLLAVLTAWSWLDTIPALTFGAAVVAILVVIAVWEWGSFHGGWRERFARWSGRSR